VKCSHAAPTVGSKGSKVSSIAVRNGRSTCSLAPAILPGKIAIAGNIDGRLQAFVRGVHSGLWTIAQRWV